MSKEKFHVSHEGQEMGPLTLNEIVKKVKSKKLSVMDYIYSEESGEWVSFVDHDELMKQVKSVKPQAPPTNTVEKPHGLVDDEPSDIKIGEAGDITEWFLLKGENKFGPFSYGDVIKMLQEKLIFEFDFIWKSDMDVWKRIAEVESFTPEKIKNLKSESTAEVSELFFRRRHKRSVYNGTIIIHNNSNVWKGRAMEISSGGAGVIMENSLAVPGDTLYLHFKPCDGVPPFNAVCEVVSKQFVDGVKSKDSPIRYGLKFTTINDDTQKAIMAYSNSAKAA